jgi:hypothetical protein
MIFVYICLFSLQRISSFIIPDTTFKNNINKINMYYDSSKAFDNPITILPQTQTIYIINNWLNATLALRLRQIDSIMKRQNDLNLEEVEESLDMSLSKSIYEFKVFTSLNRQEMNTVYFSWIPDSHKNNKQIIYLIAGKVNNNLLNIYRIAQNPYASDQLLVKSEDMLLDLYNFHKDHEGITGIKFDELHKFDNRYILSWNFRDGYQTD